MNKKELINSIAGVGRNAATAAGVGYGASKVIASISRVSEKDSKTLKKFGLVFTGVATISGLLTMLFFWSKNRSKSKAYREERKADADLYMMQRMADGELYTTQKQADIREMYAKADTGMYRKRLMEDDDESDYNEVAENHDIENKTTWIEDFKSRFTMPTLPPFIERIMKGVPSGYEEAMLGRSVVKIVRTQIDIHNLETERDGYLRSIAADSTVIEQLKHDEFLEQYARERYNMERKGETNYMFNSKK